MPRFPAKKHEKLGHLHSPSSHPASSESIGCSCILGFPRQQTADCFFLRLSVSRSVPRSRPRHPRRKPDAFPGPSQASTQQLRTSLPHQRNPPLPSFERPQSHPLRPILPALLHRSPLPEAACPLHRSPQPPKVPGNPGWCVVAVPLFPLAAASSPRIPTEHRHLAARREEGPRCIRTFSLLYTSPSRPAQRRRSASSSARCQRCILGAARQGPSSADPSSPPRNSVPPPPRSQIPPLLETHHRSTQSAKHNKEQPRWQARWCCTNWWCWETVV